MQTKVEPIANKGWGSILIFGILTFILGILFIVSPKSSLKVIVIISGIFALVTGLMNVFEAMNNLGDKGMKLIQSVIHVILGVVMIVIAFVNVDILMYVVAAYLIVYGACCFFGMDVPGTPIGGAAKIAGIVMIILGILIAVFTGAAEDVIMIITGVFFIICGVAAIVGALSVKKNSGAA